MREFCHPLDPAETLAIRRIISPARVPSKGKAIYRFDYWLRPFLVENGWEFVGQNQRHKSKIYLRSPGGVVADSFRLHARVPSDECILRLAEAFLCYTSPPWVINGTLGHYSAVFYTGGHRIWGDDCKFFGYPGEEEERRRDRAPALDVYSIDLWTARLYWLDGLENPPTWDRSEYFSALVPGLSSKGELLSDLAVLHAAELKRYEERLARWSEDDAD